MAAAVAGLPENMPEAAAKDFAAAGIVPLYGINEAMAAAEAAATCGAPRSSARAPSSPQAPTADAPPPRTLDEAEGDKWGRVLVEEEMVKHSARFVCRVASSGVDEAHEVGLCAMQGV